MTARHSVVLGNMPTERVRFMLGASSPSFMARVVCAGKRVVGFLIYDLQKTKGKAQKFSIYRFIINRKHKGKGYGRATRNNALEEIRDIHGVTMISIRYTPEKPVGSHSTPA